MDRPREAARHHARLSARRTRAGPGSPFGGAGRPARASGAGVLRRAPLEDDSRPRRSRPTARRVRTVEVGVARRAVERADRGVHRLLDHPQLHGAGWRPARRTRAPPERGTARRDAVDQPPVERARGVELLGEHAMRLAGPGPPGARCEAPRSTTGSCRARSRARRTSRLRRRRRRSQATDSAAPPPMHQPSIATIVIASISAHARHIRPPVLHREPPLGEPRLARAPQLLVLQVGADAEDTGGAVSTTADTSGSSFESRAPRASAGGRPRATARCARRRGRGARSRCGRAARWSRSPSRPPGSGGGGLEVGGSTSSISSRSAECSISGGGCPAVVHAGAGLQAHLADALVLEPHPALEHVDELQLHRVAVPLAVAGGRRGRGSRDHRGAAVEARMPGRGTRSTGAGRRRRTPRGSRGSRRSASARRGRPRPSRRAAGSVAFIGVSSSVRRSPDPNGPRAGRRAGVADAAHWRLAPPPMSPPDRPDRPPTRAPPRRRRTPRVRPAAARAGGGLPGLATLRGYRREWLAHDVLAGLVLTRC